MFEHRGMLIYGFNYIKNISQTSEHYGRILKNNILQISNFGESQIRNSGTHLEQRGVRRQITKIRLTNLGKLGYDINIYQKA